MNQPHAVTRRGLSLLKKSCWTFSPSCFQNCKINFCSMNLHFSSLRNLWLGSFFNSPQLTS